MRVPTTTAGGPVATHTRAQIDAEFSHILWTNFSGQVTINNTDPTGRYWGEDAVESVTDWDGWDEVAEFGSMMAGCWSGMNLAVEPSSSAAFAATAVAGPEAGLGVTIGSGVVGCLGGMYLAYEGADAAMDVPVGS